MLVHQFPGHSQVSQDAADAPLVAHRLLVQLRVLQDLLQHDWSQEQALLLHNRIQPLGDVARRLVIQLELEAKQLLVLDRVRAITGVGGWAGKRRNIHRGGITATVQTGRKTLKSGWGAE